MPEMDALAIYERLKERFPAKVIEVSDRKPDPFAVIEPAAIAEIGRFLYEDAETAMDCLNNETGVDYKDRVEVVYHLFSYRHRHGCVLKARLPRENPSLPTVEEIWRSANWMEREIFDLLGVIFEGHSDLRRILMPEDWPGHPLRKDFVEPPEYHGISTVRNSPIIRLDKKK
ncbi:MAG TPA: NADH-quinone oxidoreductase subunit C [Candidatus Binataceae bacterium]|nr:NADH-quinone oxidoreductase subunit C [Candidatus Binataceae bacterium]